MYVETGISLRVPYRKVFTVDGANADMQYWNQFCNVNWSAYKFSKLMDGRVDINSVVIDKFYIDIDVYQMESKCNTESAPRLEEMLEKSNTRRLWVATEHGFNCYIKAPQGCGMQQVESLWDQLDNAGVDVDTCIVDPLAQRKAVNSFIHGPNRFAIPLEKEEVIHEDVDNIVKNATEPRWPISDYWRGDQPFRVAKLASTKHDAIVEAMAIGTDLPWPVDPADACPVISFLCSKQKIGFFERISLLRYFKAVMGVPGFKLEEFAKAIVGEKKWSNMSGVKHVVMMSRQGRTFFDPRKLKLQGLCPPTCFSCLLRQEEHRELAASRWRRAA
jgi:hypothetical protein